MIDGILAVSKLSLEFLRLGVLIRLLLIRACIHFRGRTCELEWPKSDSKAMFS